VLWRFNRKRAVHSHQRYRTDIEVTSKRYRSLLTVDGSRKTHQTTIRFTDDLWARLELAAAELDVSVAQYLRDAARARLDNLPEPAGAAMAARERSLEARQQSVDEAESSAALWEQGRLARERAQLLRAESHERQRQRQGL
jgi:predicted DNA-binding protein